MSERVTRRGLLAAVAAGAAAGCLGDGEAPADGPGTTDDSNDAVATDGPKRQLPEACPTTEGIGVEYPDRLDAETAETFVESYEHVYYRDVVVEYRPRSSLDSYDLSVSVGNGPVSVGAGYEIELSGGGGVYRPGLYLEATVAEPPAAADVVPVESVDDETLRELLETAQREGDAGHHLDRDVPVDPYLDRIDALSDSFARPTERGESGAAYFRIEETTLRLTVEPNGFHGDYWWNATYYVDDRVLRRTDDAETDAREGELLECRNSE